jgi:tetratricopeptide (TPR) repeat protein
LRFDRRILLDIRKISTEIDAEIPMRETFLICLKHFVVFGTMAVLFSGCAAVTEPRVRAYIHEKKAYAEIREGQLDLAYHELKKALRDNPKEPVILNDMAYIEFKEGHYQKAVGFLEQARVLRNDDNDEPYIMNEARILIAHHEYRRALALLSLIEPRRRWPKGYKKILAQALIHNGQQSRALAVLLEKHDVTLEQPHP